MKRPYRLINKTERHKIHTQISETMRRWSQQYSMYDVNISVGPPKETYPFLIAEDNRPLALIESHYLAFFNETLFGEDLAELNSCSNILLLECFSQLFYSTHPLTVMLLPQTQTCWIYPGSTALELTIQREQQQALKLLLHPDWVYQQLSSLQQTPCAFSTLDEALGSETIPMHIELEPLNLPLKHYTTLNIGDVLVSDHAITDPIYLKHKTTSIGLVELGQAQSYKSIVLKRSL